MMTQERAERVAGLARQIAQELREAGCPRLFGLNLHDKAPDRMVVQYESAEALAANVTGPITADPAYPGSDGIWRQTCSATMASLYLWAPKIVEPPAEREAS